MMRIGFIDFLIAFDEGFEYASFFKTVEFHTYSISTFTELFGKGTEIARIAWVEKELQQELDACLICEQRSNHVGVGGLENGGWRVENREWSLTVISYQLFVVRSKY